uniref:Hypothetical conserved protein n=1 Tax=uncultured prokaryote TaxID=198431 RepID=H5SPY8_9ZZZZ|nr:hypothetical conserved protein [uncultured prokaryote]
MSKQNNSPFRLVSTPYHLPYNPELIPRARELRKNMTEPERRMWFRVLKGINIRVLRQRVIGNYIVDFYIPKERLVIEIDGDSHFEEKAERYDREREKVLGEYGLRVLRFTNEEVMKNIEGVKERVIKELGSPLTPLNEGGLKKRR